MQQAVILEDRGIDLELTLYPSFTLSLLYRRSEGEFEKIAGRAKGCVIQQRDGRIVSTCGEELALYVSGLWFTETLEKAEVKRSLRGTVDILRMVYSRLSLSVDPLDPLHVFVAVFLSQTTSYHVNVLSWTRKLWSTTNNPFEAAAIAARAFGSFQAKMLPQALECLPPSFDLDRYELRRLMLQCRHVGPKTADAFLLFALADTSSAPVDRHFASMVSKLGLFAGTQPPKKEYCAKYRCDECPARGKCLRWRASQDLGALAGWVQTVFYVHSKTYCARKLCYRCPLRGECSESAAPPIP